jgi:hypothetical protein
MSCRWQCRTVSAQRGDAGCAALTVSTHAYACAEELLPDQTGTCVCSQYDAQHLSALET